MPNYDNQPTELFAVARFAAEQMIDRLQWISFMPGVIVNDSHDTNYCVELLTERYPNAEVITSDILSIPDQSVDMIFANLVLPWCADVTTSLQQWRRILRPEGLLMFSSLGPDTLIELRESYAAFILTNLIDMHHIGDELINAGFTDPVLDVEYIQVTYRDLKKLAYELKCSDMIAEDTPDILLQPTPENIFSLNYEIIYAHSWRPALSTEYKADEAGVIKIPLSHLRKNSRKIP